VYSKRAKPRKFETPSKLDLMPEARVHEFLEIQSHGIQNGNHSLKSKATLHPLERERGDLGALAL
jgi:hypothetical protein